LLLSLFSGCSGKEKTKEEKCEDIVMSVSKSAKLYTVQYNVHKIVTYEDMTKLESSLFFEKISIPIPGDRKIALPIDATIKAYVDFGNFSKENILIEGEKITITLPDPQMELTSSKIDHKNEKEFLSWNRTRFKEKEKDEFLRQGISSILSGMKDTDIIERSRLSAYNALLPLFAAAGFSSENITMCFNEEIENSQHEERTIFNMFHKD